MSPILFDTSAFRALSTKQAVALHGLGHPLYLSPMAVWEILTHLDEPGKWDRIKGQLLKAKSFNFYDDPIATLHDAVGPAPPNERTSDTVLLTAILDRLAIAESLADFYASPVALPNGTLRHLADCAERARHILDERAQAFSKLVSTVGVHMLSKYGRQPSLDDIVVGAISLARGDLVRAEGRGEVVRIEDAANASLMFWLYVVRQGIYYAGSAPARNDYEDAQILFHLRLREERVIVTQDKRLAEVVESAESTLAKLDDTDFIRHTTVTTVQALEETLRQLSR